MEQVSLPGAQESPAITYSEAVVWQGPTTSRGGLCPCSVPSRGQERQDEVPLHCQPQHAGVGMLVHCRPRGEAASVLWVRGTGVVRHIQGGCQ